ncbi:response regulator [Chitinivibrio alkaliphilus]|uniref:histidine kinase n=1 Tax=Chitinivibrio alkaliphilus ACht1 TaxID=1313304 RepID=U7D672_9BACT|nr:response regulator [Chitinivibrio alkaliphilus]ERP31433.1 response regulator receiver sensor signal transduction histidine kinase [Chitinivibrio alkaliphilus ACht1]
MRFLIVDDDLLICENLQRILQEKGFSVDSFTSSREGLAFLQTLSLHDYVLILLDFNMPKLSGGEFLQELSRLDRKYHTYVIMMTGAFDSDEKLVQSLHAGADDFLQKPFQFAVAEAKISAGVRSFELRRQVDIHTKELQEKNEELRRSYAEISRTQARLVQQEKMASLGELAAGIAHEINNPLGFIKSNHETLFEYRDWVEALIATLRNGNGLPVEDARELDFVRADADTLLRENREGIERIENIVKNMKHFARYDKERIMELHDVRDLIRSTLVIARNRIKYIADIRLDLQEVPSVPLVAGEVNQVLLNLLINAVQSIEEKGGESGSITIRTFAESSSVVCAITDTGTGIAESDERRVFDLFYTTKTARGGSGLGLSISYDIIVQKHGGDMWFESEVGVGTTFFIALPMGDS